MKSILQLGKLREDASVVEQLLYLAMTPLRLYRQRTAVALIVSYVAMAVLTISLVLMAVFAMIIWPQLGEWFDLEDIAIDAYLGEQARAYGQWLDPDALALTLQDGIDTTERSALTAELLAIVEHRVPGFDQPYSSTSAFRIAHVAVLSVDGRVLATSDATWIAPSADVSAFPARATREVVARTIVLQGDADPIWGSLYSMAVSSERTSASYPLIAADGEMVGLIVLEGNPIRQVLGFESRGDLLRYMGTQYRQLLWLIGLPAIVVAIPFGWWRSRSISSRLERLADAADAMAEGELTARSPVSKPDEIGRLAERFNEMASTIENNERIRRAFVSNVSHELRTPISIIQAILERQHDADDDLTPDQQEALGLLRRETDMLARMINDLFTITRGDEQVLRLERRAVSFSELADEAVAGIRDLAWTQSRVSIESLASPDLPLVTIDPIRIRQVLNNLMYNALRHTPEGGLVVVQAKQLGDMLEVSVSDTGRGIPNDEIDRVFDRYYMAERGQRHDDGSGLGLSVVKQLVRSHGGDIQVESVPGEGTTFRFTVPLAT